LHLFKLHWADMPQQLMMFKQEHQAGIEALSIGACIWLNVEVLISTGSNPQQS
jgi:hypothetical protein